MRSESPRRGTKITKGWADEPNSPSCLLCFFVAILTSMNAIPPLRLFVAIFTRPALRIVALRPNDASIDTCLRALYSLA